MNLSKEWSVVLIDIILEMYIILSNGYETHACFFTSIEGSKLIDHIA